MACIKKRGPINWEVDFPHRNWPIIFALQATISVAYISMTPSLYQFITTPRSIPDEEKGSSKFWPGLGGTEVHYALAIMCFGIGEIMLVPFAGIMSEKLPIVLSLIIPTALYVIGGVLYAVAVNVWMALAGRLFLGFSGAFAVAVHAYIGEMGSRLDEVRRKKGKKPVKHFLYIMYSFIANGGFILAFGVASIMALFSDHVNPYRWPGWFLVAISLLHILVTLLVFRETRTVTLSDCQSLFKCQRIPSLSQLLECKCSIRWISYMFLFSSGFVVGLLYSVLGTLVTPVLSDQFGFSVDFTAHYLNGMGLALFGTSFVQLGVKALKVNNRIVLGISFTMALVGILLMGDWQAIGCDPCSSAFNTSVNVTTGVSGCDDNMIASGMGINMVLPSDPECQSNSTSSRALGGELDMNLTLPSSNLSDYQQMVDSCEAQSSCSHQCFWNPKSRITGEFCNTCHTVCLSELTSINFYQFTAGVLLVSLATPLGFIFISAITSDFTPLHTQGTILGLALGAGSLSRAVSPYWPSTKVPRESNDITTTVYPASDDCVSSISRGQNMI